jgi:hypothetical protein
MLLKVSVLEEDDECQSGDSLLIYSPGHGLHQFFNPFITSPSHEAGLTNNADT